MSTFVDSSSLFDAITGKPLAEDCDRWPRFVMELEVAISTSPSDDNVPNFSLILLEYEGDETPAQDGMIEDDFAMWCSVDSTGLSADLGRDPNAEEEAVQ